MKVFFPFLLLSCFYLSAMNEPFSTIRSVCSCNRIPVKVKMCKCSGSYSCCMDYSELTRQQLIMGAGCCIGSGCITTGAVTAGGISFIKFTSLAACSSLQWVGLPISLLLGLVAGSCCYVQGASCVDVWRSKDV